MRTILVSYHGPTTHRGSRMRARSTGLTTWTAYDSGLKDQDNYRLAAIAHARQLDWQGTWVEASMPDCTDRIFVPMNGDIFRL